ncbi:WG repeat-containing protein [Flavobacterium hydrophilum]|uniref:WG repeat-containing protein n=1 Tax=Flavobacterium hydrophilum TaxID=2211445 RepID=A0A2V4C0N1_9FLAO|nr:WG repeat-containing protein [Flavobacterium hydrophilum]PXY44851.1 hypothetical protein DMB68_15490 [Flavobacterium hydrophilum]
MKKLFLAATLCNVCIAFSQVPQRKDSRNIQGDTQEVLVIDEPVNSQSNARTFIFTQNNKYGLKKGNVVVLQPEYDNIDYRNEDFFAVKKGNLFGLLNKEGKTILETKYDSIGNGINSVIVKKSDKYGVFNNEGKEILPVKYNKVLYSNTISKTVLIKNKENNLELIINGQPSTFLFDNLVFYKNTVIVTKDSKKGLIFNGNLVYNIEYDNISTDGKSFNYNNSIKKTLDTRKFLAFGNDQNVFILEKEKKFGFINNETLIYPVEMERLNFDIARRVVTVEKNKLKGAYFIDTKKYLDIIYDDIHFDGVQYIEVKKNKLSGMIDYKLQTVIPIEYDDLQVQGFNNGFKAVKNNKKGWVSLKGEVIIPMIYDEIDELDIYGDTSFKNLFKVKQGEDIGIINKINKTILPIQFEYIFKRGNFLCGKTKEAKFGLYKTDGETILKPEYNFIWESASEGSKLLFAQKETLYTIIDVDGKMIYDNVIKKYNYIHDESNLLNPELDRGRSYLYFQNVKNKFGVYDETNEKECLPFLYDGIRQRFSTAGQTYFIVKKGSKFGVVNNENATVVPFAYDDLNFDLLLDYGKELFITAKKSNKYGLINFNNKEILPFIYQNLERISYSENLYKAKANNKYTLINSAGKSLSAESFDDIANFEENEALTFNNGDMKIINTRGNFQGLRGKMTMHNGYKTFDELKAALITALNSPKNDLLLEFSKKIAPSKHLLYFLNDNILRNKIELPSRDPEVIAKEYFNELVDFKTRKWETKEYNQGFLIYVNDYTYERDDITTNYRVENQAYDDRFLERLLRNSIKVNGFWISSYFMNRSFRIE